ncbi:phage integrase family domain protein [Burkholderia humptydooensis]|nr:phage integrase family domain protein [Burkholderia sp. 2002721687]
MRGPSAAQALRADRPIRGTRARRWRITRACKVARCPLLRDDWRNGESLRGTLRAISPSPSPTRFRTVTDERPERGAWASAPSRAESEFVAPGFQPTHSPKIKAPGIDRLPGASSSLLSQPLGAASPRTSHHHLAGIHRSARLPSSLPAFARSEPNKKPTPATSPNPLPSRNPGPRTGFSACNAAPPRLRPRPQVAAGKTAARRRLSPIEDERPCAPSPIVARSEPAGGARTPRQLTCNCPPRPSPPFTSCALQLRTATTNLFHASMRTRPRSPCLPASSNSPRPPRSAPPSGCRTASA